MTTASESADLPQEPEGLPHNLLGAETAATTFGNYRYCREHSSVKSCDYESKKFNDYAPTPARMIFLYSSKKSHKNILN